MKAPRELRSRKIHALGHCGQGQACMKMRTDVELSQWNGRVGLDERRLIAVIKAVVLEKLAATDAAVQHRPES